MISFILRAAVLGPVFALAGLHFGDLMGGIGLLAGIVWALLS
jgi:hypothetical protein